MGEEGQIVLADLVSYCSYYQVAPPGASLEMLADHNARRAVFGRIFHFLHLTDEEVRDLGIAARLEAMADATEGHMR